MTALFMASNINVTDLSNLPSGMVMTLNNASLSDNIIRVNNQRLNFSLVYQENDALFKSGTGFQLGFQIQSWTKNYVAAYCRGKPVGTTGSVPGYAIWTNVSIMTAQSGDAVLADANTVIRTNQPEQIILEVEFIEDCWGFEIYLYTLDSTWTRAAGTGDIKFNYLSTEIVKPSDPYAPGGGSTSGGGEGDFDDSSDPIDFPDLPNISATDTGFIRLFNPSTAQLRSLATYMWTNSLFDLATWKKIFADPMDAILGLSIVPVPVPSGGAVNVTVGNIPTDVSMTTASAQYVEVDCGTLNVNEFWGAYLDYSPFTKCEIYLPYCGTHPLDVDDVMGKAVHVKYHVDILSGACACYVKCGDSVLYTFIGQCASSIPITGNDWTNVINGVISAAVSVGSMVATGGAAAPMAVPALASTVNNSLKPQVEKSGAMGGTGGMLGIQVPYLILTRPNQALPESQNSYTGYPAFITRALGDLSGYTEVEQIHLDGISCSDEELTEIEGLLKGGVIL